MAIGFALTTTKTIPEDGSHNTMFKDTLLRLRSNYMPPIITTNIQYESLIVEDLDILQEYKVILEPVKIGTAEAILTAALLCN